MGWLGFGQRARTPARLSVLFLVLVTVLTVLRSGSANGKAVGSAESVAGADRSVVRGTAGDRHSGQDVSAKQARKLDLEIERLELENQKLRKELSPWVGSQLFVAALGFVGGLITAGGAWWTARRTRLGTFDQAVHTSRLGKYAILVTATEPLALYFPESPLSTKMCTKIGERLRASYFSGTGVLLSVEARDRYFELVRALTRAGAADAIDAPELADYPQWINDRQVDGYRRLLRLPKRPKKIAKSLANWRFGETTERGRQVLKDVLYGGPVEDAALKRHPEVLKTRVDARKSTAAAYLFRDFVLLQLLSSLLRTSLAADLRGRRRPS